MFGAPVKCRNFHRKLCSTNLWEVLQHCILLVYFAITMKYSQVCCSAVFNFLYAIPVFSLCSLLIFALLFYFPFVSFFARSIFRLRVWLSYIHGGYSIRFVSIWFYIFIIHWCALLHTSNYLHTEVQWLQYLARSTAQQLNSSIARHYIEYAYDGSAKGIRSGYTYRYIERTIANRSTESIRRN